MLMLPPSGQTPVLREQLFRLVFSFQHLGAHVSICGLREDQIIRQLENIKMPLMSVLDQNVASFIHLCALFIFHFLIQCDLFSVFTRFLLTVGTVLP